MINVLKLRLNRSNTMSSILSGNNSCLYFTNLAIEFQISQSLFFLMNWRVMTKNTYKEFLW